MQYMVLGWILDTYRTLLGQLAKTEWDQMVTLD